MMKMATGEGSPSGKVPKQGLDWFLVATEACGGRTPDLLQQGAGIGSRLVFGGYRGLRRRNSRSILLLDVFRVYGHILAKEVGQVSHEGPTRVGGAPRG